MLSFGIFWLTLWRVSTILVQTMAGGPNAACHKIYIGKHQLLKILLFNVYTWIFSTFMTTFTLIIDIESKPQHCCSQWAQFYWNQIGQSEFHTAFKCQYVSLSGLVCCFFPAFGLHQKFADMHQSRTIVIFNLVCVMITLVILPP